MRARTVPTLALVALLALGGLAAAEGGGDGSGTTGSSSGPGQNGTAPPPETGTGSGSPPPPPPGQPPNCDQQPAGAPRDRCLKERYCASHPADTRCGKPP